MRNAVVVAWSPEVPDELAGRIRTVHGQNQARNQPTIVCIAGGSSTGKSTQVAVQLHERLHPMAQVLAQDNFQLGRDFVAPADSPYGWDAPENYGLPESRTLLETLKAGQPAPLPVYSFAEGRRTGVQQIEPVPMVLFEGLYAGFGALRTVADVLIYVESPLMARMLRRLFRSCFERYRADSTRVLRSIATGGVLKAHHDLVRRQRPAADVVIQMPYRFADSIRHFGLTEQPRPAHPDPVLFSAPVDDETELRIERTEQRERWFYLFHQSKLYFACPIDDATFDWLRSADFTAY